MMWPEWMDLPDEFTHDEEWLQYWHEHRGCPNCGGTMEEVFELSYPHPTLTKYKCESCGCVRRIY